MIFLSLFILVISSFAYLTYLPIKNYVISHYIHKEIENNEKSKNKYKILVDINDKKLYLIHKTTEKIEKTYVIASGKTSTPSPIGTWTINSKGTWGEGFGSRWMGLNVPWGKYGIHGTDKPSSIGGDTSHGCIRMFNKDAKELYSLVSYGTTVVITGGPYGPFGNNLRIIKPGYRGSDVYEIQRIMKEKGYYPGYVDGIYGEGMKSYVIKFRKDNNLSVSHNIDASFYKVLGIGLFE